MRENNKVKAVLINRTDVTDENLMRIVSKVCEGQNLPDFYLICQTPEHNGVTITNLDRPCVVVIVKNPQQFIETLRHEIVHLRQHALDYASEEEVELIVTDKHKTMNEHDRTYKITCPECGFIDYIGFDDLIRMQGAQRQ